MAKGVAFDPAALEKGKGASVRVRRDVPVGIDLPARYAFDVRYDRTGRSYWISADSFKEKLALFRVKYPNPDCESSARFETETVGDTVFRRRFPAGDGPWTVRAEVRDVHGETFATNIVVRRPANAVRAPAPNDLILVGQTGYGAALDLAADVFERTSATSMSAGIRFGRRSRTPGRKTSAPNGRRPPRTAKCGR